MFLQLPSKNLIGWWKFDERTGIKTLDSSGNRRHGERRGTLHGNMGQVGWAIECDSPDDSVNVPYSPAFDIENAMTVTAWFRTDKPGKVTSDRVIMGRSHSWEVYLDRRTSELTFECHGLELPSAYPEFALSTMSRVDDAQWHHVSAVYDGATMSIYVDGVPKASTSASVSRGA